MSTLTTQEKQWLIELRITRLTDNQEVLIYPMGAERYLSSILSGNKTSPYPLKADIEGKDVLVIPGYGNSAFLFAEAGAKSVTVYDKDPVTIAWVKAFKTYYYYREFNARGKPYPSVGELLTALTRWYPPLMTLPSGAFKNSCAWVIYPKALRRNYLLYMMSLVRQAVQNEVEDVAWHKNIRFYAGEVNQITPAVFDTAFVPYLLGVKNGIEREEDIVHFMTQITQLVPTGAVLVTPGWGGKEFHFMGQRYFETTNYASILELPGLQCYAKSGDRYWFKTQGLAVFRNKV